MTPFDLDDVTQYPAGASYSPAIPNDAGAIQTAILAQLLAQQPNFPALAGVEIAASPDSPESWRAVNQVGTILVRYQGSDYGRTEDVGEIVQAREMKFLVGVLARGLGWSDAAGVSVQGGYSIIEACIKALLGFKIPGCEQIYIKEDEFIRRDRQGGIWIYGLHIVVPTVVVAPAPAAVRPILKEVISKNTVGSSTETVTTLDEP